MSRLKLFFGLRWMQAVRDYGPPDWDQSLRAILYVLSTYMDNDTGETRVSQALLAKGAGLSREAVSRKLRAAREKAGLGRWLAVEKRRNREGHLACLYKGLIPPDVRLLMAAKPSDGLSQGPSVGAGGPSDDTDTTQVTERHTNYLENYLGLRPDGLCFSEPTAQPALEQFVAGLTGGGWQQAMWLTSTACQADALDALTVGHVRELVSSGSFFRDPLDLPSDEAAA